MRRLRKSAERGHVQHGWLDTYHTFSFASYRDPEHVRFRALRVINEDRVAPGQGFDLHPHQDMEIVTYVLSGALEHRDSLGHGAVLRPGELQRMTAGTGLMHSEFNPSDSEPVHLYQIWLFPRARGLEPSYEQRAFPAEGRRGQWQLVAAPDGREGALRIETDARLYLATLGPGESLGYNISPGRHAWLQILRGRAGLNGTPLEAGDGVAFSDEAGFELRADEAAELLLFDLA